MYDEMSISVLFSKIKLTFCFFVTPLVLLVEASELPASTAEVHLFFSDLLFHRFYKNCKSVPVLLISLLFEEEYSCVF